jgi:hypothetical protein
VTEFDPRAPPRDPRRRRSRLIQHAEERSLGTITIRVAALADIVRSKEAAGRDKDIRALTELYELLHRKGE